MLDDREATGQVYVFVAVDVVGMTSCGEERSVGGCGKGPQTYS